MTAVPSYTVICDGCQHAETPNMDLGNRTAAEARKEAHYGDWVTRGSLDFCLDCQDNGAMRATLLRRKEARR